MHVWISRLLVMTSGESVASYAMRTICHLEGHKLYWQVHCGWFHCFIVGVIGPTANSQIIPEQYVKLYRRAVLYLVLVIQEINSARATSGRLHDYGVKLLLTDELPPYQGKPSCCIDSHKTLNSSMGITINKTVCTFNVKMTSPTFLNAIILPWAENYLRFSFPTRFSWGIVTHS